MGPINQVLSILQSSSTKSVKSEQSSLPPHVFARKDLNPGHASSYQLMQHQIVVEEARKKNI